jgi:demethylmenaquinone methyltransferase/2-methoxy-6-polyprenyl-1,4-benzoquinol methylase
MNQQSTKNYTQQTPESIQQMFGSIAQRYDRANAVMSFNMHKIWNARLIKEVSGNKSHTDVLDLCCGTGDIIFGFLKKQSPPCKAHCLDFCEEMLECARMKEKSMPEIKHHQLSFIQGDAQEIPLKDNSIDCATVAYGIRNVKDPAKCIADTYRVLKKGGIFGILELTIPENPIMKLGHRIYLQNVLPLIGRFVSDNQMAYEYLCNSIHTFIPPKKLMEMLKDAKFTKIKRVSLLGGVATIITGEK